MSIICENADKDDVIKFSEDLGVKGIGFILRSALDLHGGNAYKVAIDAKYKTNQKNMELVSLMTEADGVGFPCFNEFNRRN